MTRRILLAVILLGALTVRVYFAAGCDKVPDYSDMAIYNEAALAGGIPSFPPPGYPLFLRLIYSIFGTSNYRAVFIVQAILSAFAVFLVYYVAKRVAGGTAAFAAAVFAAFSPNLIVYNLTTLTESLSVMLAMLILAAAVSGRGEREKSVTVGVLLALSYFVKPAFLFFFPGLFLGMKRRLALVLTVAALLGPVIIYGSLTGSGEGRGPKLLYKAYNMRAVQDPYFGMEETELGEDATGREYLAGTIDFIMNNKWLTLDIIYGKASLLISKGWDSFVLKDISGGDRHVTNILIYGYLPVMVLGLIGLVRFCDERNRIILFVMISYLVIHILITIFKMRYRLLVEPMLMIYSGIVVERASLVSRGAFSSLREKVSLLRSAESSGGGAF